MKVRRMLDDQAAEAARLQRRDYEEQAQSQSRGAGAVASVGNQAAVKTYSASGIGWGEARRQGEEPLVKGLPSWAPPVAHLPAPVVVPDEATRRAFWNSMTVAQRAEMASGNFGGRG